MQEGNVWNSLPWPQLRTIGRYSSCLQTPHSNSLTRTFVVLFSIGLASLEGVSELDTDWVIESSSCKIIREESWMDSSPSLLVISCALSTSLDLDTTKLLSNCGDWNSDSLSSSAKIAKKGRRLQKRELHNQLIIWVVSINVGKEYMYKKN